MTIPRRQLAEFLLVTPAALFGGFGVMFLLLMSLPALPNVFSFVAIAFSIAVLVAIYAGYVAIFTQGRRILRVPLALGVLAVLGLALYAIGYIPFDTSRDSAWWLLLVLSVFASVGVAIRYLAEDHLRNRKVPSNQPLHPTPTAAEAPASGAGERRR